MAKTSYLTPEDQAFIDAWRTQTAGTSYAKWGTTLPKLYSYADKLKNIQSFYTHAKSPQTEQLAIDLGVEWLKANNPGILDETGNQFGDGFYADIISGDKTTQKSANDRLNKIRDTNATQYVDNVFNADKKLGAAQRATEIAKITQGTTAHSYNPTDLATAVSSIRSSAYVQPGTSFEDLKAKLGGFTNADGTPLFSDAVLRAASTAKSLGELTGLNQQIDTLANKVLVDPTVSKYVSTNPADAAAAKKNLLADSAGFVAKVNAINKPKTTTNTDTATSADTTTTKPAGGIASLRKWHAPQQGIATANSPYSGLLDATLAKVTGANFGTPTNNAVYKNLTDPLTQGMGLDSLAKPKLTYDTSNPAGITGLGNVSGTLQPLNTQVTSSPSYTSTQIANAKTALDNATTIAKSTVPNTAGVDTLLTDKQAGGLGVGTTLTPINTPVEDTKVQQVGNSLLSKYNFNDYIAPETRQSLLSNPKWFNSLTANTPDLINRIEYSALVDSRAGNTTPSITATSLQNASSVANQYNPITTAADVNKTPVNTGIVSVLPANSVSQTAMNSNVVGDNGTPSIASLLIPNIDNSVPTNTQPNYATGLTMNTPTAPIVLPNIDNSVPTNTQPNPYGQYATLNQAVSGGMTQDQINAMDEARNRAAMAVSAASTPTYSTLSFG